MEEKTKTSGEKNKELLEKLVEADGEGFLNLYATLRPNTYLGKFLKFFGWGK